MKRFLSFLRSIWSPKFIWLKRDSISMTQFGSITAEQEVALKKFGHTIYTSKLGVLYVFDKNNNRIEFKEQLE